MAPRLKSKPRKRKRPLGPSSAGNVNDDADGDDVADDQLKRRPSTKPTPGSIMNASGNRKRKPGADEKKPFFCEKRGCFVYSDDAAPPAAPVAAERKSVTPPRDENDAASGKATQNGAKKKKVTETAPKVKKECKEENGEEKDKEANVKVKKVR